jgi:arabinofuranosyltransferase
MHHQAPHDLNMILFAPVEALALLLLAVPLVVGVLSASGKAPTGRQWVQLAMIGAALPVGYEIFRMGYYAALVPNTAIAKEAGAAYWPQGWLYAKDFVLPYALWLPLAGVAAWAIALLPTARRSGPTDVALVIAPMCAALAHGVYITRVGGDFMHGRLFLPSLLGFLLPVATVVVVVRPLIRWRVVMLAGIGIWIVACAAWLRVPYWGHGRPGPGGIADERGFYTYHMRTPNPVYMADYLRHPYVTDFYEKILGANRSILFNRDHGLAADAALAPSVPASVRDVLGIMNVGVLGYLSGIDVHIADLLGLGDPLAARLILGERSRPGHEKVLPDAWVVARFGDPEVARARFPDAPVAAKALTCGEIAKLLHAISDPLTPRRFLANMRDAWSLHHLRIPADPAAAVTRFCPAPTSKPAAADHAVSG